MSIFCRLRWHRWSVWGVVEKIRLSRISDREPSDDSVGTLTITYIRQRQARQCINCGRIEYSWLPLPPTDL